jgi:hypothetical protein
VLFFFFLKGSSFECARLRNETGAKIENSDSQTIVRSKYKIQKYEIIVINFLENKVIIQAACGNKILCRERISPLRKNVQHRKKRKSLFVFDLMYR